jgi:pyruvate/2-oxoacid:ferredoxin oxidoreductase beta subunit
MFLYLLLWSSTNTIIVKPAGCLEVTGTPFPLSSWQVPWIHSLFENAGAVASGIEAGLKSLKRERYQGNRKGEEIRRFRSGQTGNKIIWASVKIKYLGFC